MDFKAVPLSENLVPLITPHLIKLTNALKISDECQTKMQMRNKKFTDNNKRPQVKLNIGDQVLAKTRVLSNAKQLITAEFVPKRDGPYTIIQKKGLSSYAIASANHLNKPIATVHVSDLTLFKGKDTQPMYPMRPREGPKGRTTSNTEDTLQQAGSHENEHAKDKNNDERSRSPRLRNTTD